MSSTMEAISEDDEVEPSVSWFCCLSYSSSGKNTTTKNGGNTARAMPEGHKDNGRPSMDNRRGHSVYVSARDFLGEDELAALKEFEEAVVMANGGDESLYYDALDQDHNNNNQSEEMPYAPAQVADPRPRGSLSMEDPNSLLLKELTKPRVNVALAGYPGNLTPQELNACQQFRAELKKRKRASPEGSIWEEVVRIYNPVETEPYALCRFLRARQFNVDKVMDMIADTFDIWREARKHDYFPDPNEALGAPVNVLLSQLPTLYAGCAKNGAPVAYAKARDLSIEGIECVTELSRIEKYAWFAILHKFKAQVARAQQMNPNVVRCEAIQVVDLKGLNASALNKRTLECLQNLINVNKCFPEVLNSMVILNAPRFFTFAWRVIKTMLDPRTASKVVMFSSEKEGIEWMMERIDKSELLSDYGGTGDSFEDVMNKQNVGSAAKRQVVKLFSITQRTNNASMAFSLTTEETATFTVYTRSAVGAGFELWKGGQKVADASVDGSKLRGSEGTPVPIQGILFTDVQGPGEFSIKSKGKSGQTDHFVVAGEVF
ncbi:Phosphatidylinositol/phosphatidylcholine transfer protein [Seminavis robusta]|uniref:Phosphatidylinositol/phosphatidylcholine transfer protein n=1 Tax=Seminavis robusta TaxID=568900 RepID=A0A9N8HK84_9STRA|nr:Phosphatidylinositol/phosphatidylcholine transfer protein [Seminavis robusta]|eukprot:Sro737_g195150.1 Phosphatidylinositol/phosphatidylcholine transfer protein (546) ;mRNA; f:29516-31349